MTVIPAYAGMTALLDGAQAPYPPLPRRGEDAANAAGEGTAVGAQAPRRHSRLRGNDESQP